MFGVGLHNVYNFTLIYCYFFFRENILCKRHGLLRLQGSTHARGGGLPSAAGAQVATM